MTSSIGDSRDSPPLREEMGLALDGVGEHQGNASETLLKRVEDHPAKEVTHTFESLINERRDRTDVLPNLLDELDVDQCLSEGTDAQRALIGTIQRLVAKHTRNRRKELIQPLVEGLSDPARRKQAAKGLSDISSYSHTIAGDTINELENAPVSLFSDPAAVDAVTDVVASIEESHHRYKGEAELPAIARLQIGTDRKAAKRELANQAERSESEAEDIAESVAQLLETVDDDGPEAQRARQAAREILFKITIASPEIIVPYADRLANASGIEEETVVNAYTRVLNADTDAAESLFVSVAAEATLQEEPDQRIVALANLLSEATDDIVTAIVKEMPENDLTQPPVRDETAEQLHEDNLHLLALLCTEATAPIGQQLIAIELEEGVSRLAKDLSTVVCESNTGQPFDGLSQALERTDDLPSEVTDEMSAGLTGYLQRSNASVERAATLATPVSAIGQNAIKRVLADQDPRDGQSDISEKTFREFVKRIVETNPDVVAAQCTLLLEYGANGTPRCSILESVGEALERAPVMVVEDEPSALDLAVDLLGYEDDDVVVHACRVVAHLEPYPAPREIVELEDEASGRIEQFAEWALEYIENASRDLETDIFTAPDNRKPALTHLSKRDDIKYRSDNVWESLRLGPLEMDILNSILAYYNSNQSALVTHPAHNPRITLLYAVALLCEGAVDDRAPTVGIASPVYGYKNRWGTFGDIEAEYRNYGVNDQEGATIRSVTFDELFGTAKVKEGQLSTDRRGDQAGEIVLTKSLDNLSQVTDDLTAVVVQAVERFKISAPELVSRINEDFDDTPVFPIYSATTKQDTGGVPDIAPPPKLEEADINVAGTEASLGKIGEKLPDVDAVRNAARSIAGGDPDGSAAQLNPPIRGTLQAAGYTWPKEITVRAVGNDSLRESIDEALDIGFDLDTGGSQMLNTVFQFERLPVNASDFDAWVEDQDIVNPRSQTKTVGDQLDEIEDSTDRDHISSEITIAVREGLRALDSVNDEIQDANPIFERLLSRLKETVNDTEQVGVVVARQSFANILDEVLTEGLDASIGDDVVVLTPGEVSGMISLDRLFVVGPQRPAHAAVYFPSCTSQIEVLTIGTFWENYIKKHASRYRDELVEGLAVDCECLGQLSITTEDETTVTEEPEPRAAPSAAGSPEASEAGDVSETGQPVGGDSEAAGAAGGSGGGAWLPDSLTEAFERAAEVEGEHGSGEKSYGALPTYEVETESGETVQLGRGEAIYRIEDLPGRGQSYSWTPPSGVKPGDEILVIDPSFYRPRRDEWLQRQYEQQFNDPESVFRGLYDWWTAMSEIIHQLESEARAGSSVLQSFYKAVKHEGVNKHKQTVRLWIKAIEESDAAIELATNSEGTKGPDQADDIEAIGRAFNKPDLEEGAKAIEDALDRVRKFNAIGGRQYREVIEEQLEQGHQEFREAATPYAVVVVRELDS